MSAESLHIINADDFFTNLSERVQARAEVKQVHPASVQVAVAMLKKFLPKEENRIKVRDLVMNEVKQTINACLENCKGRWLP